jgi:hypothetical protein
MGDLLSALPAMGELSRQSNKKLILYCWLDREATYYEGAVHPIVNKDGRTVMMNESMFNMSRSLLLAQDFIEDVKQWSGEDIDVNFDVIRDTFINMPYGSISRWYFMVYPNLTCDLSKIWLNVPEDNNEVIQLVYNDKGARENMSWFSDKLIVSRTQRYTNPMISYFLLKDYPGKIVFSGTVQEWSIFCGQWKLDIPLVKVENFLQLAQIIKRSKLHVSNQTMTFQLSEGMKHPRAVELCRYAPNVIPVGENAFDFYSQTGLNHYVERFLK